MSIRFAPARLSTVFSPSTIAAVTLIVCAVTLQLLLIRSVAAEPLTAMAPAVAEYQSASPSQGLLKHVLDSADSGHATGHFATFDL